jgi:hypothetical protein
MLWRVNTAASYSMDHWNWGPCSLLLTEDEFWEGNNSQTWQQLLPSTVYHSCGMYSMRSCSSFDCIVTISRNLCNNLAYLTNKRCDTCNNKWSDWHWTTLPYSALDVQLIVQLDVQVLLSLLAMLGTIPLCQLFFFHLILIHKVRVKTAWIRPSSCQIICAVLPLQFRQHTLSALISCSERQHSCWIQYLDNFGQVFF